MKLIIVMLIFISGFLVGRLVGKTNKGYEIDLVNQKVGDIDELE